jgi:2-dehydropantoate 2-reductase
VAAEVSAVAYADGYPLSPAARSGLDSTLTDPASNFAPSMFRDLSAHRRVEVSVLADLAERARRHHIDTPLLDAALVVVDIANDGL